VLDTNFYAFSGRTIELCSHLEISKEALYILGLVRIRRQDRRTAMTVSLTFPDEIISEGGKSKHSKRNVLKIPILGKFRKRGIIEASNRLQIWFSLE